MVGLESLNKSPLRVVDKTPRCLHISVVHQANIHCRIGYLGYISVTL
jgi:hypothetical protein